MASRGSNDRFARILLVPVIVASLAALAGPGCSKSPTTPAAPLVSTLTLDHCWPNANGDTWTFLESVQPTLAGAIPTFPDSGSVPAISIDDAIAWLAVPPDTVSFRDTSLFVLQFHGDTTTTAGVHAQQLLATHWMFGQPGLATAAVAPFAHGAGPAGAALVPSANTRFLVGGAFRKTAAWMGAYADYDTALAMEFLDANLVVGHTFTLHPPSDPGRHTLLTARVVAAGTGSVPGTQGTRGIVQVVYLLDYGVDAYGFNGGVPFAWVRMFDYGRVTYAAGLGPIADEERIGGFAGAPPVRASYLLRLRWQPAAVPLSAGAAGLAGPLARRRVPGA